jgi:hypothetical protein
MRKHLALVCIYTFLLAFMLFGFLFILDVKGLTVHDGEVKCYVNGSFTFNEAIVLQGNATLVVENATLEFVQTKDYQYGIELWGLAGKFPSLRVENATLKSSKGVLISFHGNSSGELDGLSFDGAGKSKGKVTLYDGAYFRAASSIVPYVYCYNSSRFELAGSNPNYLYVYNNSSGVVDGCTIYTVKVFHNGLVNVSLSTVKSSIYAEDVAKVFVSASSLIGDVSSSNNSTVGIFSSNVNQFKANASDFSSIFLENVTYSPYRYPSEVNARSFASVQLVNCMLSNFNFRADGNSKLYFKDSSISSSTFYFYGNSEVEVSGSYMDWLVEAFDKSRINAVDSTFNLLSLEDGSNLDASGCSVGWVRCYESSSVVAVNSKFREVLVELVSLNTTLSGFHEGYFERYSFVAGGLNTTFLTSSVDAGWSFRFLGVSNVTFYDSRLINLYVGDQSMLHLFNTSYANLNVREAASADVWSYLVVRVVDYFGAPVGGVNVTVLLPSPVTKFTDDDGEAVFPLFEKFVNASGEFPTNRYSFKVVFDGSLADYSVELTGSRLFTCNVASPWWYWYMIYGIVAAAIIGVGFGVFTFLRRKHRRGSKASPI